MLGSVMSLSQPVAPERVWKWGGGTRPAQIVGNFLSYPRLFWLWKYN